MRDILLYTFLFAFLNFPCLSQIDTAHVYSRNTAFGTLDIRLSKGGDHHYYLEEGRTFSFRTDHTGPTNSYLKMTAWDSSPYSEGHMRERSSGADLFVMNYRLLKPQQYKPELAGGYPLVIVMHGFLERGNCAGSKCYHADEAYSPIENIPPASTDSNSMLLNNDYNLVHAGSDYLEAHYSNGATLPDDPALPSRAYPGFVLFPQNLNGWDPSSCEDAIRLIRLMSKKYNIDQDRIYINGISHGGYGAYEVLKRAPWLFAGGVLFSAASDAGIGRQKGAERISGIPLWIFQGALDEHPTQRQTENYVNTFRKAGAVVRYTLYPQLGHGTWNKALDEPDFFSWLLAQRRNKIHVDGGKASICATEGKGLLLELPQGFRSYEWELDGTTIFTGDSNTFLAESAGVYRARFQMHGSTSASGWGKWSEALPVIVATSEVPEIDQIGTLLLRDLNGNTDARLQASGDFPLYYWYRNGKLIKAMGDTLRTVTLEPTLGNGDYSLRVANYDGCKSQQSEARYVVFNDEAPIDISSPFDLKGVPISPSEVLLTWSDTSATETLCEIWRKATDTVGDSSKWIMAGLTNANTLSFSDAGLEPGTTYGYKIRAVSRSSRSSYFPGADAQEVHTPADQQPPTPPLNLLASQAGANAIRLSWEASVDNSAVQEYIIYYSGHMIANKSSDTTFLLTDLELNTDYSFTVRAVDVSGNFSPESNTAQANTFMTGLYYEHSTGAWENITMIDWTVAEFSGVIDDFSLAPRTQQDFFNFMFDGFLSIRKEGVYQLRVTSDDGSILLLDDSLLIENDGIHNAHTVTSPVQILGSGPHRITLKYFDYVLSDTLLVEYKGPDSNGEWVKIPPEALASQAITSTKAEAVPEETLSVNVFPNPVNNQRVKIQLTSLLTDPILITIRTTAGNVVYDFQTEFVHNLEIVFPFYLQQGVYIVTVRQGLQSFSKRLVILPD